MCQAKKVKAKKAAVPKENVHFKDMEDYSI